ncbi:hypothetical protein ASPBRDRAFT_613406 [Aspergillus brasiliensis CBS 101740]|uniref:Uncharacterized protein n=1 Tax=Aspergillus brasiliensis (strain CBS 101740 / IMI 381727 / IBT 21946) TaxID=767769 RepID=A0A1L9UIF1_ASPBC|nr:hypothetical protein ASPBRDRAFT_613406 [Aspergillus brasiliensis CBS 101740]
MVKPENLQTGCARKGLSCDSISQSYNDLALRRTRKESKTKSCTCDGVPDPPSCHLRVQRQPPPPPSRHIAILALLCPLCFAWWANEGLRGNMHPALASLLRYTLPWLANS